MPYTALPADYDGPAWVTCPNELYDPQLGHHLYNRYLDELIAAEDLGFDGVCVNEHHQNAYGNMPSPNLIASILARQPSTLRIRPVTPWPRPIQQPHPEVWVPGVGSLETMEFVARHHYAYMGIPYFHIDVFKRSFRLFREACQAQGYEADPLQAGWLVPIYV